MVLIILGVVSILAILCFVVYCKTSDDGWAIGGGISLFFIVICVVVFICGLCIIKNADLSEEKIIIYQEENTILELKIEQAVQQYLKHEASIYPETLFILIPELKGNALVEKQVEIYTQNKERITELKAQKLNARTWRFILWFG